MWHRIDDPDNPPPKDGTLVIWYCPASGPLVGRADDYLCKPYWLATASHWMPFPPPPAEDTP